VAGCINYAIIVDIRHLYRKRLIKYIKEYDYYVENLQILTMNRKQKNIIFISSNPIRT
jgi:hypothetical protein